MVQTVKFGGSLKVTYEGVIQKVEWVDYEEVRAIAVDVPTSGYNTFTINCLRKWKFVENPSMKDVCTCPDLAQKYFYVSATIQDCIRRYKKVRSDFTDFALKNTFVAFDPLS